MKNNSLLCAIVAGCAVLLGAAGCSKEYLDAEVIDDTLLQEVVSTNNGLNSVVIEMLPMLQNGYVPEQLDCNPEDIPEFVKPYMLDFSDYDAFTKWDVRTELVRLTADSSLDREQKLTVARCLGGQLYYRNLFQDALSAAMSMNRSTKAGSESLTANDLMTDSFFSGLYVTNNLRRKNCLYTKSIINIPVDNDTGDRDSLAYEGGAAVDTTEMKNFLNEWMERIEQRRNDCYKGCLKDNAISLGLGTIASTIVIVVIKANIYIHAGIAIAQAIANAVKDLGVSAAVGSASSLLLSAFANSDCKKDCDSDYEFEMFQITNNPMYTPYL